MDCQSSSHLHALMPARYATPRIREREKTTTTNAQTSRNDRTIEPNRAHNARSRASDLARCGTTNQSRRLDAYLDDERPPVPAALAVTGGGGTLKSFGTPLDANARADAHTTAGARALAAANASHETRRRMAEDIARDDRRASRSVTRARL